MKGLVIMFDKDELNLLRIMRKRPHRETFHMLANTIGVKFERMEESIQRLESLGYIQQDSRDKIDGFMPGYTYFTSENKRAEIDSVLKIDYNSQLSTFLI